MRFVRHFAAACKQLSWVLRRVHKVNYLKLFNNFNVLFVLHRTDYIPEPMWLGVAKANKIASFSLAPRAW
jgi:hypothetical protein